MGGRSQWPARFFPGLAESGGNWYTYSRRIRNVWECRTEVGGVVLSKGSADAGGVFVWKEEC